MAFDITKALGDISRRPATDERGRRELRYIPLHMIDQNPRNFYSTEGIDELADNIRMVGLMEPLIVRESLSGRYMLISGHRRRLALRKIAEEAENYPESMHEPVACMVENGDAPLPGIESGSDDELRARQMAEELKLIYANADTRVMSSADTAQQVRRIRELFTGLQDLGYQFPGKMRDHVAAAAKVSATRVARLDVIQKNLEPSLRKAWREGTLGETSAYEIARRPKDVQKLVAQRLDAKVLGGMTTERVAQVLDACEADGNRDREAREDWNKAVGAMAEAAGSSPAFDGEAYLKERRKEDLAYRRAAKAAADSFFWSLTRAPKMTGFRNEDIEEVKTEFRHAGHGSSAFSWTGLPKGMAIGSNDLHIGEKPRTWTEFYDVLAAIAINRCVEQAAEVNRKPAKVSAADTGIELHAGTPTEPGEYMTRIGVGPEETRQTATWQRLEWHTDGSWCFPKTGAPLPKGTNVFRWFKLPEV